MPTKPLRRESTGSFTLAMSAERALPYFTPEGERAWAEDWSPVAVFPPQEQIVFENDAVFYLSHGDEHAVWTILQANAEHHTADYLYVVQESRVVRIKVWIDSLGPRQCRVHVRYTITALSDAGVQFALGFSEEAFASEMLEWQEKVTAAAMRAK